MDAFSSLLTASPSRLVQLYDTQLLPPPLEIPGVLHALVLELRCKAQLVGVTVAVSDDKLDAILVSFLSFQV